jgi:hypothetical protein
MTTAGSTSCGGCEDLELLVTGMERAGGLQFEVLQVKEKFGGLRFYVKHANDAIRASLRLHRNPSIPARSAGEPGIRERYLNHILSATVDCGKLGA